MRLFSVAPPFITMRSVRAAPVPPITVQMVDEPVWATLMQASALSVPLMTIVVVPTRDVRPASLTPNEALELLAKSPEANAAMAAGRGIPPPRAGVRSVYRPRLTTPVTEVPVCVPGLSTAPPARRTRAVPT